MALITQKVGETITLRRKARRRRRRAELPPTRIKTLTRAPTAGWLYNSVLWHAHHTHLKVHDLDIKH